MKKYFAALLTVVLAFSFCVVGFADVGTYEPTTDTQILEKSTDDGIAVCRSECPRCGEMSVVSVRVGDYELGPYEATCIHSHNGIDYIYEGYIIYQEQCGSCGYHSPTWDICIGECRRSCGKA